MRSKISKIGIIGGSGVEELLFAKGFRNQTVETNFGEVAVREGQAKGKTIVFLNRHGWKYTAPSLVDYRANLSAMKKAGVNVILATAAVGSLSKKLRPGDLVILDDFIDLTRQRDCVINPNDFFDLSCPYSPFLINKITDAAQALKLDIEPGVTYACMEGPRFETRAEIRMLKKLGADVVGMTQVPEVVLAAELGIPYAVIGVITNFAAGITSKRVSGAEVLVTMKDKSQVLSQMLLKVIEAL